MKAGILSLDNSSSVTPVVDYRLICQQPKRAHVGALHPFALLAEAPCR